MRIILQIKVICIVLFLTCFHTFSQSSSNRWYFGNQCGIIFSKDKVIVDTLSKINAKEGTSAILVNDSFFFYSDGIYIYNKNHNKLNVLPLKSHPSSTQGSIMLTHPDNDSIVFMITNSSFGDTFCQSYFYSFKITNDTTLILINEVLLDLHGSEKISAVNHNNGRDIWVITHSYFGKTYKTYLLTKNGLNFCPIINVIGTDYGNLDFAAAGQIKFSPDGNKVIASTYFKGFIDFFKFDKINGKLSDEMSIEFFSFGCEFSIDGSFAYFTNNTQGRLIQYDLKYWNYDSIKSSEKVITDKGVKRISALQLASDGKIYWSNNDSTYLAAIEEPNKKGDSCKVNLRNIYLNGRKSAAGLPTFNQSYFYTPAIDYSYEISCTDNSIKFWGKDTIGATAHIWQISKQGKGAEATYQTQDITHYFADTGMYEVRYVADNGSRQDTVTKSIMVHLKLKRGFLGADTTYFCEGDTTSIRYNYSDIANCIRWENGSASYVREIWQPGTYSVAITSKDFCLYADTITIIEHQRPSKPQITQEYNLLKSNTQADFYQWYRNGLAVGSNNGNLVITDTGTYRVEVWFSEHCKASDTLKVYSLSVEDFDLQQIRIFPNPVQNNLYVKIPDGLIGSEYTLSDISGRILVQDTLFGNQGKISFNDFAEGIYLLQVKLPDSQVLCYKVFK